MTTRYGFIWKAGLEEKRGPESRIRSVDAASE
jgi:hypothetical protein